MQKPPLTKTCFKLDTARASMAHSSPIMTAIRDVVPHIDEDVFNTLSDRLIEQLRSSVGVTTRTGTCQFIIDLCLRRQQLLMSCQATCGTFFWNLRNKEQIAFVSK